MNKVNALTTSVATILTKTKTMNDKHLRLQRLINQTIKQRQKKIKKLKRKLSKLQDNLYKDLSLNF